MSGSPERRQLPECAIDWAEHQLTEHHRSRRDVAAQLQINRRTLDRRLLERAGTGQGLLVRCHCGALTRDVRCANGHLVPLFLPRLLTLKCPTPNE